MAKDNRGLGSRRPKMEDRSRVVVYLDEEEKAEIQEAAYHERITASHFTARAALAEARRIIVERELSRRRSK